MIVPALLLLPSQSEVEPSGAEGGSPLHSAEHVAAMAGSSLLFHDQEPSYPWAHCFVVAEDAMYQAQAPRAEHLFIIQRPHSQKRQ